MRSEATLLLATLCACFVPPLDPTGRTCTSSCPAPHQCQAGICVAQGGRLCAAWPDPKLACFDFEGSTTIDAATTISGGELVVDTSSRRNGANSLAASVGGGAGIAIARLSISVPTDWRRIVVSYDVRPQVPASATAVSLGEVLCNAGTYSGLWLFYEGRYVARTGQTTATNLLQGLENGAWNRVTLEVNRMPTLRGTVRIGAVEAAVVDVPDCLGPWTVEVGMSGQTPAAATYDDVLIQVERP